MYKKIILALSLFFIPYLITTLFHRDIQVLPIERVDRETLYIVGTTMGQMPVTYEKEALKAQMVLVQTSYYKRKGEGMSVSECMEDTDYISMEEAENIWGREQAMEYYENLTLYYEEIKGVTATYQDAYIEPVYHRLSAGATRPGETTLGEVYGYLQSAASRMDIESKAYLHTKKLSYEELTNALSTHISKGSLWIVHSDEVGYVDKISVNNKEMTGEEFRKKCQLNSANFTMLENEVGVVFTIKGEGHGYGLSQYGANRMAAEGKSYEEILKYYFSNIELHSV